MSPVTSPLSRRGLLKGAGVATAATAGAAWLTGCGSASVSVGSNMSDDVPKIALAEQIGVFNKATGTSVEVRTFGHNSFQNQIEGYLQGSKPDQVFTWFAGSTMQRLVDKGLVRPLSAEYATVQGLSPAMKRQATATDGNQYLMPTTTYPWAVHYRKSLFAERGYEVPRTWDEFVALCKRMRAEELFPLAWGIRDGWTLLGLFSIINLRVNGVDYHRRLLDGVEGFDTPSIQRVLELYASLLPYHMPDAKSRVWQEAAVTLRDRQAGMYYMGSFLAEQFPKGEQQGDIGMFPFPVIDESIGQDVLEAPVDGFMLSTREAFDAEARDLVTHLGQATSADHFVQANPTVVAVNARANRSAYRLVQNEATALIQNAAQLTSFLDREMRPGFVVGTLQPQLASLVRNSNELPSIMRTMEKSRAALYDQPPS